MRWKKDIDTIKVEARMSLSSIKAKDAYMLDIIESLQEGTMSTYSLHHSSRACPH